MCHGSRVAYVTKTLLAVDGHSMAYRAFFALPVESFTTSSGQATNAIYGFVNTLVRMIEADKPTHLVVAFDLPDGSFRNREYPEYKAGRAETPEDFKGQVSVIRELLSAMGIVTITKEDFEADDILATLARSGAEQGYHVLVASGDRDMFQVVSDRVTLIYPGRSAADLKYMDPAAVRERSGVEPARYPEVAALVGEDADNLSGVPGVGLKTAAGWLNKFDGLTNLIEHADQIGGKRGQALRDHIGDVERNRNLNALVDDLDLPVELGQLESRGVDREALDRLFDTLDFTRLRDRVYAALAKGPASHPGELAAEQPGSVQPAADSEVDLIAVADENTDFATFFAAHEGEQTSLAYNGSGRPARADLTEFALVSGGECLAVDAQTLLPTQEAQLSALLPRVRDLVVFGGKAAEHAFASRGWRLPRPAFDAELAAYLVKPERRASGVSDLAVEYLGTSLTTEPSDALFELADPGEEGQAPRWATRLAEFALTVGNLREPLQRQLDDAQMGNLLTLMEIPVSAVLADLEALGIAVDSVVLGELAGELSSEAARAEQDAFAAIGGPVNLGSPKQLQVVLFDQLQMPKTRKTKTGYTTNAEALVELYAKTEHPFLEALLRHRDYTKLAQTVTSLQSEVTPDGRIHTTFSQTVAATGRLSSSDPNLQNIPVRSETGMRIRGAFVAGTGFVDLMSVDYSQIEMRIMAHLSGDQALIDAFNSGEDLHRTMAAMVFGVPVEEVTGELRSRIKATSYGLAYGLSPYGLSRQLGVPVDEAKTLHARYFERFAGIGRYLAEVVETARETGYTETMFGRRRYFPQLRSSNRRVRDMAERAALNAPIQGSAADIIKMAMIEVHRRLTEQGFASRVVLQVHDELLLEIAPGERGEVEQLVREAMAQPVQMSVPLDVAVGVGPSWQAAAH